MPRHPAHLVAVLILIIVAVLQTAIGEAGWSTSDGLRSFGNMVIASVILPASGGFLSSRIAGDQPRWLWIWPPVAAVTALLGCGLAGELFEDWFIVSWWLVIILAALAGLSAAMGLGLGGVDHES